MSSQPWTLNSHQVSGILSKQLDAVFGIAVCIAAFTVFREGVGVGWGAGDDNTACTPQWSDHRTGDQMIAQLFGDKLHWNITRNIHLHKTNILL
jgi:hypothetical protein